MKTTYNLTLGALALLGICAIGCNDQRTTANDAKMTDDQVENAVEGRFRADAELNAYNLDADADVDNNKVTLSGTVPTQAMRTHAIDLAKQASPGAIVEDKIDVKPAEVERSAYTEPMAEEARRKASAAGERVGSTLDDAWIHAKIRTKLMGEGETPFGGINVDVENNHVTLRGDVESAERRMEAERIAKGVDGVSSVRNQLVVKRKG